jgi:hypothetical protein
MAEVGPKTAAMRHLRQAKMLADFKASVAPPALPKAKVKSKKR